MFNYGDSTGLASSRIEGVFSTGKCWKRFHQFNCNNLDLAEKVNSFAEGVLCVKKDNYFQTIKRGMKSVPRYYSELSAAKKTFFIQSQMKSERCYRNET